MNKERLMHSWVYNAALRDAVAQMRGILICCGAREAKDAARNKYIAWFNGSHFRPTRMISSGSQIAAFGVKVCRHHPFRVIAFRLTGFAMGPTFPAHVAIVMRACCVRQPMWVPHFTPTLSQMRWCSQSCVEALLIESPFLCHIFAFHSKKPGFLPRTPLVPPNEPCNFLCEMALYLEICHAYSGDGGGS